MSHSFQIVEEKLLETDFFLEKFREAELLSLEAKFYFSAFASAARSTTLSIQKSLKGVHGFEEWYGQTQSQLKGDVLAAFFLKARNDIVHQGLNPLNAVPIEHLPNHLRRQLSSKSNQNVLVIPASDSPDALVLVDAPVACQKFMATIVSVSFDCYSKFKTIVDPRWYFTEENFRAQGRSLTDALGELGYPPSWLDGVPTKGDPWRLLRRQEPRCILNDVFMKYVGRRIPDPDDHESGHGQA